MNTPPAAPTIAVLTFPLPPQYSHNAMYTALLWRVVKKHKEVANVTDCYGGAFEIFSDKSDPDNAEYGFIYYFNMSIDDNDLARRILDDVGRIFAEAIDESVAEATEDTDSDPGDEDLN